MTGTLHLMWSTSDRIRRWFLRVVFGACVVGYANAAFAQYATGLGPVGTGAPQEPPISPPVDAPLPTGQGMLSIGPFLLTPTLDTSTFYNSNIYSTPTNRLQGPGFRIRPSLNADWNTGIYDLKLYGNIDSEIYPTLNGANDTFNRQAGVIDSYSPLRDLTFTAQFDYTHNSLASVVSALPSPVISPLTPVPVGAAGVVALQQLVVNPNDNYTATVSASKQFNRAYLDVGATFLRTQYQNSPQQDFDQAASYASGGAWLTPQLYAFADAIDANSVPRLGLIANSYRARAGIGTAQIGAFQGSVYFGHQGTSLDGDGSAGGDIYGGTLTYYPTPLWNMSIEIDRLRNRSDIAAASQFAIGGLTLAAVPVPTSASVQVTDIAYRTNYDLTAQTSLYAVLSDDRVAYLDIQRLDNTWIAAAGANYKVSEQLSLSLDYLYSRLSSTAPGTSFTQNVISLGARYRF